MTQDQMIFLNYSDAHKNLTAKLCDFLESSGYKCWYANRDILAGDNYMARIVEAIKASNLMIFLISEKSCQSKFVSREVEIAYTNNIPIIPLRLEDFTPTGALEYSISESHWLDVWEKHFEEYFPKILASVGNILNEEKAQAAYSIPKKKIQNIERVKEPPEWVLKDRARNKSLFSQILSVYLHPFSYLKINSGDRLHLFLAQLFSTMVMFCDMSVHRFVYPDNTVSETTVIINMTVATLIIPFCLYICYLLPFVMIPRGSRHSWTFSFPLLLIGFSIQFALMYTICFKGTLDFTKYSDWSVPFNIGKDCNAFMLFAFLFLTNTWNHVQSLRVSSPYIQTIAKSERGTKRDNPILPSYIIELPLVAYIIVTSIAVIGLFIWDIYTIAGLKDSYPGSKYYVMFGIMRDTFGVFLEFEIFVWYYNRLKEFKMS